MTPVSFVLELILAALLAACLYYCWRLDKQLRGLRSGQDGVRAAAIELAQATAQAEAAVRALRQASQEAGAELQSSIEDARRLSERVNRAGGLR
ncbi:MAG: DUF6468 domain-containing protein [Caulobacterales bacterium]|jgi:hypothetical protein